ncbi:MAG: protein kinase [Candidatus Aminicenantes bacterium]|nr:protein kinase [Candidatus Aminicenantes bacterium]
MIGQTISHYKILEKLGEGGMGVVYKAEDTQLKRTVALKFLPPEFSRDKEAKKRFLHEAQAAAALEHTNICPVYEIDETEDGQMFIAMAYYEGETLREKISGGARANGGSPWPLEEAIDIAFQVAEGLDKAHQKEIVHRDVKSANIIITKEGIPKILDFGLAKLRGQTKLTKEGTTIGTVAYMSPEQTSGEEMDQRTDIWSLGVVLYEMIAGQLPFKGHYEQAVIYSILNEKPEPVTTIKKNIPSELDNIISKALAKKPDQRYKQINEMLADLKQLKQQYPMDEVQEPRGIFQKPPSKLRKLLIPGIVLLATIFIITGFFLFKGKKIGPTVVPALLEQEWTNSVAVLPFRDFSPKKDQEYFCDGMTDALIDRLSRLQSLKVTALTSVLRYKNTNKDIKIIGKDLGVRHLVEGTVQREENRIRVRAQLIKAETGFHLWSNSYDRTLESVFEVQDDISQAIANALKLKFTPQKTPKEKYESIEAYEYYLKGLSIINNTYNVYQREEDFQTAIKMFEKAIETDPGYAEAYVGLAWAYQHHNAYTGSKESQKLVEKYAKMAYKLNPDSVKSNTVMGWIHHIIYNQNDQAYNYFKRARENILNTSGSNFIVGLFLMNLGLYHQAIPYYTRAHDLDPFYSPSLTFRGYSYMYTGEFFKAAMDLQQAIRINPNSLITRLYYIRLCNFQKKYTEATEQLEELEKINPHYDGLAASKAMLFAIQGEMEKALATYTKDTWFGLQIYSILNMKDKAFELLDKDIETRYLRLKNIPFYDNLRGDPRFQMVLRKAKEVYEERVRKYGDL